MWASSATCRSLDKKKTGGAKATGASAGRSALAGFAGILQGRDQAMT
jgi:hypothetical protein